MKILVLNAGSSSYKTCLYEIGEMLPDLAPRPVWEARIEGIGPDKPPQMKVLTAQGASFEEPLAPESRVQLITRMLSALWSGPTQVINAPSEIDMVGHRVVHGGRVYRDSVRVTEKVKDAIADLAPLAPAHNPVNLQGIETVERLLGAVPQIAVFDTAFHSTLPDAAAIYPGPYAWAKQGIRRYGFHGISHSYCAGRAARILGKDLSSLRLISCHLGNGCSLAAIRGGRSVDTTMGFTPLEGLMMGTRSGSVDPGLLIHLMRGGGLDVEALDEVLNHQSGLKGVSGLSEDMRVIEAAREQGNTRASLAFDMYVHRMKSHIGAMLASLGGMDALIFTAGIGENSAAVRAAVCEGLEFLGLGLDSQKNASQPSDEDIATPESTTRVLVIQTQEDWAIARECWKFKNSL